VNTRARASVCLSAADETLTFSFSSATAAAAAAAAADVACNNGRRSEDALASPRHGVAGTVMFQIGREKQRHPSPTRAAE